MKKFLMASFAAAAALFAGTAHADRIYWSVGINSPVVGTVISNAPVYVQPPVVYAPPPQVFYQPAPVYHAPPRVVYQPPQVVYQPQVMVYGRGGWGHHHHGHRGHRGESWGGERNEYRYKY
jgi:hypothetical protein